MRVAFKHLMYNHQSLHYLTTSNHIQNECILIWILYPKNFRKQISPAFYDIKSLLKLEFGWYLYQFHHYFEYIKILQT